MEEAARQEYELQRQAELNAAAEFAAEQQRKLDSAEDSLKLQASKLESLKRRVEQQTTSLLDMKDRLRAEKGENKNATSRVRELEGYLEDSKNNNIALQRAVSDSYRVSNGLHARHLASCRSTGTQASFPMLYKSIEHDIQKEPADWILKCPDSTLSKLQESQSFLRKSSISKVASLASNIQSEQRVDEYFNTKERPSSAQVLKNQRDFTYKRDFSRDLRNQLNVFDEWNTQNFTENSQKRNLGRNSTEVAHLGSSMKLKRKQFHGRRSHDEAVLRALLIDP